jgi:hypothetical protein
MIRTGLALFAALAVLAAAGCGADEQPHSWTRLPDSPLSPREGVIVHWTARRCSWSAAIPAASNSPCKSEFPVGRIAAAITDLVLQRF